MPNTVRTVADILNLPAWPSEQLRLVVERWQPAAEVRIERIRWGPQGGLGWRVRPVGQAGLLPVASENFWVGALSAGSRNSFQLCPDALRQDPVSLPAIAFSCVPCPVAPQLTCAQRRREHRGECLGLAGDRQTAETAVIKNAVGRCPGATHLAKYIRITDRAS